MKGRFDIRIIRKFEAEELRKNGYGDYVKKSYSRNPTYYIVTEKRALKFLEEFRKHIKK